MTGIKYEIKSLMYRVDTLTIICTNIHDQLPNVTDKTQIDDREDTICFDVWPINSETDVNKQE